MSTNVETNPIAVDTALADAFGRQARLEQLVRFDADRGRTSDYEGELDAVTGEVATLNAQYAGWSRFFLVNNSNGHIHSNTNCSTCYPSTQFGWLPSVSGRTEADAVAEFGEILCSVCFPTAPVAWCNGVSKATQAERDAKAVVKAEKEAKRLAAALLPDGSPLRVGRESFKTLRSAQMWLTDSFGWNRMARANGSQFHGSYGPEAVSAVVEAIAAKTQTSPEGVYADAKRRAEKRDGVRYES